MNSTGEYLGSVLELARTGPSEAVATVIDARLRGREDVVVVDSAAGRRSIASPSLGLDDADHNALLYEAYRALSDEADSAAIERLRRAVVELLMRGLGRRDNLEYLAAIGRLVGYTRVVDSEPLAQQLRQQLLGYMEGELPLPFHRLIELEGENLNLAILAIDVWLAIMPVLPEWPGHISDKLLDLVDHSFTRLRNEILLSRPKLKLLSFAYRALIKLRPAWAGERLWVLCTAVAHGRTEQAILRRQWLAVCRHQGVVFSQEPMWRDPFIVGVRETPWHMLQLDPATLSLLHSAIEKLDIHNAIGDSISLSETADPPMLPSDGYVFSLSFSDLIKVAALLSTRQTGFRTAPSINPWME